MNRGKSITLTKYEVTERIEPGHRFKGIEFEVTMADRQSARLVEISYETSGRSLKRGRSRGKFSPNDGLFDIYYEGGIDAVELTFIPTDGSNLQKRMSLSYRFYDAA